MKKIEVSSRQFSAQELKNQIEAQYAALNGGRWGWDTVPEINAAIAQAEEELSAKNGRCPKTATCRRAYEILRDGKLIQY